MLTLRSYGACSFYCTINYKHGVPCILKKSAKADNNLSKDAWIVGQAEFVTSLRPRACPVDQTACPRSLLKVGRYLRPSSAGSLHSQG
jgi:hypothetical protein